MYFSSAYLGEPSEDIVNTDLPLLVTAVGYYHVHSKEVFKSYRKYARKDYLIIYVASGKLHLLKDGEEHIIKKGSLIVFRPGTLQMYKLYAKDQPKIYWVHFTGNSIENMLSDYRIYDDISYFFVGISRNYTRMFNQMIQELRFKRADYINILAETLRLLFRFMGRNIKEGVLMSADLMYEVEQAMHYFDKYFYMPIIIDDYAKEHHMTPWWFIQNFKKIAHLTPMQYIVSLRINNAMGLLVDTNYSIAQIAATVGYEDSHYFSRLFAKHIGVSPMEYRKSKREKQ